MKKQSVGLWEMQAIIDGPSQVPQYPFDGFPMCVQRVLRKL